MLIGINGWFLTKLYTGIGQYTHHLFSAVAKACPHDQLLFAVPQEFTDEQKKLLAFPPNVEIAFLPQKFPGTGGMKKTLWEQVQVPAFFLKRQVDIAHFPYPSNPWGGAINPLLGVFNPWRGGQKFPKPVMVTVHDTIPWTLPEYRKHINTRLYQERCQASVPSADHIFTVSEATQQELESIFRSSPGIAEKISVTPNAVSPFFTRRFTPDERAAILAKYGLPQKSPFFLYLGGYDERKNVRLLVETFLQKIAPEFEVSLVLAGGKPVAHPVYDSFDDVRQLGLVAPPDGKKRKGELLFPGFIDEADLPALYQSCYAFVNLSRKEGFNMPLLEAAISGAPLVTSNTPVHHEVVGEYAVYIDLHDAAALGETLKKLLTHTAYYQELRQKMAGFQSPFSWEKSAETTAEVYRRFVHL